MQCYYNLEIMESPTFECRDCNLIFVCKEDFSNHIEETHKDPVPQQLKNGATLVECPECFIKFTQKSNLMRHMRRFHTSSAPAIVQKRFNDDIQECPECNIKFTRRSNLIRHFRRFHKFLAPSVIPQKPKLYACPECETKFTKWSNCKRHMRKFHELNSESAQYSYSVVSLEYSEDSSVSNKTNPSDDFSTHNQIPESVKSEISSSSVHECFVCHIKLKETEDLMSHIEEHHEQKSSDHTKPNSKLRCIECDKFYSTRFNLNRHMKHFHPEKVTNVCSAEASTNISELKKCPLCDYNDNKLNLYVHFSDVHNIPILIDSHEFDTLQQFEEWRVQLEEKTDSHFVKVSKTLNTETSKIVLACSRSEVQSNGKTKAGFCPAEITMIVDSDKCSVYFVKVHVGHVKNEYNNRENDGNFKMEEVHIKNKDQNT